MSTVQPPAVDPSTGIGTIASSPMGNLIFTATGWIPWSQYVQNPVLYPPAPTTSAPAATAAPVANQTAAPTSDTPTGGSVSIDSGTSSDTSTSTQGVSAIPPSVSTQLSTPAATTDTTPAVPAATPAPAATPTTTISADPATGTSTSSLSTPTPNTSISASTSSSTSTGTNPFATPAPGSPVWIQVKSSSGVVTPYLSTDPNLQSALTATGATAFDFDGNPIPQSQIQSYLSSGVAVATGTNAQTPNTSLTSDASTGPGDGSSPLDGGVNPGTVGSGENAPPGTVVGGNLGTILFRNPDGTTTASSDISQIGTLMSGGSTPYDANGPMTVTQFQGGQLLNGLPMNYYITGGLLPAQISALNSAGLWNASWNNIPLQDSTGGTGGGTAGGFLSSSPAQQAATTAASNGANTGTGSGSNPGGTNPTTGDSVPTPTTPGAPGTSTQTSATGVGGTTIPSTSTVSNFGSATSTLQQLINALLNRTSGADSLSNSGSNVAAIMSALSSTDAATRNAAISALLPGQQSTIQQLEGLAGTSDPYSPQALAALNLQNQAGIPQQYNQSAQTLATSLLQSGADNGVVPGSASQIINAYSPLMAARNNAMSQGNANTIMANENQKLQSLMANNQTASQAVGMGVNLNNSIGNIYNPNTDMSTAVSGLNTGISGFNAGSQGLSTTAGLGGSLASLEPTSFQNMLLAAALSTGSNLLSNPGNLSSLIGLITGGSSTVGGANSTPNAGNPTNGVSLPPGTATGTGDGTGNGSNTAEQTISY